MKLVSNVVVLVLLSAFAAVCVLWGVAALFGGNPLSGVIVLIFALACIAFSAQWAVMRWSPNPRVEYSQIGTTVRPRKLFDILSITWVGAALLAALLYIVFVPLGLVDIPTYRSSLSWLAIFLVVAGVPTLWRMVAHGGDSYLRLTPTGCEVWNGQWLTLRRADWKDIERIEDQPPRRTIRGRDLVVLVLADDRSATLLADALTPNVQALREWVRFYWQHPECRIELSDDRGLKRLNEKKFSFD